jgi:hypothetical protein
VQRAVRSGNKVHPHWLQRLDALQLSRGRHSA